LRQVRYAHGRDAEHTPGSKNGKSGDGEQGGWECDSGSGRKTNLPLMVGWVISAAMLTVRGKMGWDSRIVRLDENGWRGWD